MTELKKRLALALKEKLDSCFDGHGLDTAGIGDMLEYPPDEKMGDFSLPCFKLSRALRKGPPQIASELANGLCCDGISKIETVGGYLNFFTDKNYYKSVLGSILDKKEKYGAPDMGCGKTVILDYSSPNVAKPFHIGHLGTTVIGHSLKKLHEFCGYKCYGINHLGDWGTQFGKLIVAYNRWGDKESIEKKGIDGLVELYVRFHSEAEADPSLEDLARAEFTKLEGGDAENTAIWKWFVDLSIAEYKKTYAQLGIEFDSYMGESFYYDKTAAVVSELSEKGLLKIDDGASIVDLSEYDMPPCLILKSDGSTIYAVRDLAAALYRMDTYNFEKAIYVTSAGQSLHFAQVFKTLELMGRDWAKDKTVHVPYGTVSINGAKLATRTGNVILLKDLFAQAIEKVTEIMDKKNPDLENKEQTAEAVGVGAIVFHYLYNNRIRDINFMIEDALSFDGNTGPYAQYTYARCCGILEKAEATDGDTDGVEIGDSEAKLLKVLSMFEEKVLTAVRDYEPSVIVRYIIDICGAFNSFYHDCHILSAEDEKLRLFRVKLTQATKTVLGSAFELICLKKTERV